MIRLVVFLGALALFLPERLVPTPPYAQTRGESQEALGIGDMMEMMERTGADLAGLCDREPEVCRTGAQLGGQMRDRALAVTGAVHGWLQGMEGEMDNRHPTTYPRADIPRIRGNINTTTERGRVSRDGPYYPAAAPTGTHYQPDYQQDYQPEYQRDHQPTYPSEEPHPYLDRYGYEGESYGQEDDARTYPDPYQRYADPVGYGAQQSLRRQPI